MRREAPRRRGPAGGGGGRASLGLGGARGRLAHGALRHPPGRRLDELVHMPHRRSREPPDPLRPVQRPRPGNHGRQRLLREDRRPARPPHDFLPLAEVLLLRPDDASRPHDPEPSHSLPRREAVVLHHIECNESAGAAKASLAVNRECSRECLGQGEEFGHHSDGGRRAVLKVEVDHGNAGGCELFCIVLGRV